VRSGTASIENGSRNILAEERLWRPTKSQFGSVAVDSGILERSDKQAQTLVRNFIGSLPNTEGYTVEFQ
jgi:hypothetical protein